MTPTDDHPAPALPVRHQSMHELEGETQQSPCVPERKQFGSHLPPPTRTIAPGDKLPPPRRVSSGSDSSSDEEEEEDEDVKLKLDLLPDATRASRRLPVIECHNYSEFNIHVTAYSADVAAAGHWVAVAGGHHVRVYDLSVSDAPLWNLESKHGAFGPKMKDTKLTSVEFRPTLREEDRGAFVWVGAKDGHLLEIDVRTGKMTAMRPVVHAHSVSNIFRHGQSMVTVDQTGKVLVWTPPPGADLDLATQVPRVVRITEKQDFVKMLSGQLWTSTREAAGAGTTATSRGPYVPVYNVFTPGSVGCSLLPTEHLGKVTAGTLLPLQPGHVFLSHEGGMISIWALEDSGPLQCVEVVKISSLDVMSLEGVNNCLWAGSRGGTISAYNVLTKPWTITNS